MTVTIDLDTATALVKQLYPNAIDPMLTLELELTRGVLRYRPYAVYFKFLLTEYRQLVRAGDVGFQYDILKTAKQSLEMQRGLDIDDTIPDGQSVDDLLSLITDSEANNLGINIY